jgi:hypothetical protein
LENGGNLNIIAFFDSKNNGQNAKSPSQRKARRPGSTSKGKLPSGFLVDRPIAEGQDIQSQQVHHGKENEQSEVLRETRFGEDIARNLRDQQGKAYGCEDGKVLDHALVLLGFDIILT